MEVVDIYVDGSFGKNKINVITWAYAIVKGNKVVHQNRGSISDKKLIVGRQVAGECKAVIEALRYCSNRDLKCNIYFDYIGLKSWIADIWNDKPWKANKEYTKAYRNYCLDKSKYINSMIKVKGHSGNKWNDYVDELCNKD